MTDRDTTNASPAVVLREDVESTTAFHHPGPNQPLNSFNDSQLLGAMDFAMDSTTAPLDSFWPFSTSWQWTHEDLFLQDNTSFMPGEVDASEITNTHIPQDDFLIQRQAALSLQGQDAACEGMSGPSNEISAQTLGQIVNEMISLAVQSNDVDWATWSIRLSPLIKSPIAPKTLAESWNVLDTLKDCYFKHFQPLWPLINSNESSSPHLHPLLFLAVSSVGALFSKTTAQYGSLMHSALRNALLEYRVRSDQPETEALDIGRAMLLTQVSALYFEQEGAFSAAEQLGARLLAHTYRMRLFILKKPGRGSHRQTPSDSENYLAEGRRLLAYGMLRAETFLSVLFNRKPLLSYEEIDLPLPFVQHSSSASLFMHALRRPGCGMLFSDLVRIALDTAEPLPLMSPADLEMLIFGLQNDVWRFSHDPEMFSRLLPGEPIDLDQRSLRSDQPSRDLLDRSTRKMTKLITDYQGLIAALSKWNVALQHSQLLYPVEEHRSRYLSGMILLDLSFLRLCAPIDAILQVAYHNREPAITASSAYDHVVAFVSTPKVNDAITHARTIWHLLNAETSRQSVEASKYNILALIALHIAAAVTWAVAGSNVLPDVCFVDHEQQAELMLRPANTHSIMLKFVDVYSRITATWGTQSSFSRIVKTLADHPFTAPT